MNIASGMKIAILGVQKETLGTKKNFKHFEHTK